MDKIIFNDLTATEKLILYNLTVNGLLFKGLQGFTTSQICEGIGTINDSRTRRLLHGLANRGFVECRKLGKRTLLWSLSGYWSGAFQEMMNKIAYPVEVNRP